MRDGELDDIINSLEGAHRAMPTEGSAEKVMQRWYLQPLESKKSLKFKYLAAACMTGFTLLNTVSYGVIKYYSIQDDKQQTLMVAERQFTDEYKLVTTSDYYKLNENTK